MNFSLQDLLVLLIPVVSAVVGWATNVVAIKMMFYPVDFVGVWKLGWQGIVPANATRMASASTQIITEKLLRLDELFANFDAEHFTGAHLEEVMDETVEQVIEETAAKYAPEMWAGAQEAAKGHVRQMVRADVERVLSEILAEVGTQIEDILDLEAIVVDTAERDRAIIGEMFQTVGAKEFDFIRRSGGYFGFLFGLVQLGAWLLWPEWWLLPTFGFFVGYVTNFLALKLIFEPAEPKRIGPWTLQGLFHKRQAVVAEEFSKMVSRDILNPENMVSKMISGPGGDKLFAIVTRHVDALVTRYAQNPLIGAMIPADKWDEARVELHRRLREELPKPGGFLHVFAREAVDIYSELVERMVDLDAKSFEGILRPPFQQDEWKLIIAGGVLGLGAGLLQLLYLLGESV
ncbi:DUF445 domain-containing protein [Haliangium ochraceum]|uniref:DUF445 domain-containing protein n=1 Tax=Haliangium ochraceum (strain DSM 14365 / JCM 11303 / SMP-2) TaxID=502025 RepID=D0LZ29_HALO1|nr:DUF445 family protein [Haliangium ochraceum]ACY14499.1 conserved hypothetical protein [Haliangium ochraceum DSM 14365]